MIYLFSSSLTKELNPAPVSLVIYDVQGRHDPLCTHCEWQHEWQPLPVAAMIRAGLWGKLPLESHLHCSSHHCRQEGWCWDKKVMVLTLFLRRISWQTNQCHLHLVQQSSIFFWLLSSNLSFFPSFNFSLNTSKASFHLVCYQRQTFGVQEQTRLSKTKTPERSENNARAAARRPVGDCVLMAGVGEILLIGSQRFKC